YLNESSQSTYKLLDNLLEWARLENGSMPYRPKALQLDQLIEDTVYSLQFMAAQKNINLTTRLQSDIWIEADRHMLQSLVHNLVANALKFTPNGGTIQIFDTVKDDQIIISVQDNGTGMNEVQLQKLFNVAYSQSTNGTNGEPGTGLGLLLCQQFVQQHKGTIQVHSELGYGSTFSFNLPLERASQAMPQSLSA
ncbi:MAG: HAMP domain-containing histidine kinase, partial [Moraxellaceae bacterium]